MKILKKIPKKIAKKFKKLRNLFLVLCLVKTRLDRLRKGKKKLLVPNSVHTRPGEENSKNNSKKIQRIEKPLSGIISSRIRM